MKKTLPFLLAIVLSTSACTAISPPQDGCKTDQQSCITHPGTVGESIKPQSSN
jgi:hypothetical protein